MCFEMMANAMLLYFGSTGVLTKACTILMNVNDEKQYGSDTNKSIEQAVL